MGRQASNGARRTCCSWGELKFGSQNQHGNSKPPAVAVPGYPMLSLLPPWALHALGTQTYMWININTHKVKINLKSEEPSWKPTCPLVWASAPHCPLQCPSSSSRAFSPGPSYMFFYIFTCVFLGSSSSFFEPFADLGEYLSLYCLILFF